MTSQDPPGETRTESRHDDGEATQATWSRKGGPGRIALLLAIVTVAAVLFDVPSRFEDLKAWIRDLGALGPVMLVAVYVVACVFFLPGSLLTLMAGAIYGVLEGYAYVAVGSILGATAAFLVGRTIGRGWIESKLSGNERFRKIDGAVAREGWRIVLLTRLSPVFPFNVQNYMYGVTGVPLRHFVWASWVGMIPGTFLYVYLGSAGGAAAAAAAEGEAPSGDLLQKVFFGVGLLATAVVTVYVTRLARRALDDKTQDSEEGNEA